MGGNSADRRTERRAAVRKSKSDKILWCLAAAVAIILWLIPDRGIWPTFAGLIALAVLLAIPVLHLPMVSRARAGLARNLNRTIALMSVCAVIVLFGFYVWPVEGLGDLTERQRNNFQARLKKELKPIPVHLMCAPNDERDCAVATQFISMFAQVGWRVKGNLVDRVYNGAPERGLYFVLHSTADRDPSWPKDYSVWTKVQPAYGTAKAAFDELHIKNKLAIGFSFPEDELGIYFGTGTAKP
jgi:hypothetical protein